MTTTKKDYELAREELESLYAKTCPQGKVVRVGLATDTEDGRNWPHTLWSVVFDGVAFPYKTGTGIKTAPTCAEVLASACRDAIGGNQSFADFCSDYGYDEDSRKAEAVYFPCQDCGKLALRVLKTRALVQQFADLSNRL